MQTGGRYDIVRHARGTILYELNGASGWLQTGEMIQVGAAWRLTGGPLPGSEEGKRKSRGREPEDC